VKNYYTEDELRRMLEPISADLRIHIGQRFWWVRYLAASRG